MIEILGNIVFYVVRYKDINIQNLLKQKKVSYFSDSNNDFEKYYEALVECIKQIMEDNDHPGSRTRVYLRTDWNDFGADKRKRLRDNLYIATGVNLNFLSFEQEQFYKNNQPDTSDNSIICGIAQQELRSVVLCGSFRKYLAKVREVYQFCVENGIEVLSPQNLHLKDMFNDNFALFHGEYITEERETYLIESKHTDAIKKADAIIVCNPDGYIGTRTLYENYLVFINTNDFTEIMICTLFTGQISKEGILI